MTNRERASSSAKQAGLASILTAIIANAVGWEVALGVGIGLMFIGILLEVRK